MKKRVLSVITALIIAVGLFAVQVSSEEATKPGTPKITSVKKSGIDVTIKWEKVADANGYIIYYTLDGARGTLTAIDKKSTTKYTAKNMPEGSYTFFMEAYKTVNGKKIHGDKSNTKKITIGVKKEKSFTSADLIGTWEFSHAMIDGKKSTAEEYAEYGVKDLGLSESDPRTAKIKETTVSELKATKIEFVDNKSGVLTTNKTQKFTYTVSGNTVKITFSNGHKAEYKLNDKGDELSTPNPTKPIAGVLIKTKK